MSITDQTNSMIQKNSLFDKEFLDYIKNAENDVLYTKGKNIRHKSEEGGLDTVGYGHKLTKTENAMGQVYGYKLDTLTEEQANAILLEDLKNKNQILINKLGTSYTNLDPKRKQMLLDIEFNVKKGIDAFPKFKEGVLQNKIDVMKKEYERKFTDSKGVTKPLTRRNELFSNFFFGKN
jgi:hypothetical protein